MAVKVVDVADEDALEAEFSLLRTLSAADSRCFPKPLWCGRQTVMGGKARVMVMNLLGESLEQISQRVTMGTGFEVHDGARRQASVHRSRGVSSKRRRARRRQAG